MASDEIAVKARAWLQTKYPDDVALVGYVVNPERENDFSDGYTQGRADALKDLTNDQLYKDGYNNGFMDGRAGALKELEQLQREAYNAGQDSIVLSEKMGFSGWVKTKDYLSSKSTEAK